MESPSDRPNNRVVEALRTRRLFVLAALVKCWGEILGAAGAVYAIFVIRASDTPLMHWLRPIVAVLACALAGLYIVDAYAGLTKKWWCREP